MAKKTVLQDVKTIKDAMASSEAKRQSVNNATFFMFGFLCLILFALSSGTTSTGAFILLAPLALLLVLLILNNMRRRIKCAQDLMALRHQLESVRVRNQRGSTSLQ